MTGNTGAGSVGALVLPRHHRTVAGGSGAAIAMSAGQRVHVVNTLGQQVVDTWAVGSDTERRLSMSHTRLAIGRISPRVGDVLVDDQRQPMLRLVEDDSLGDHDTLIPACDAQRYRSLGYQGQHASCADNYATALSSHAMAHQRPVPDPLNLFMAVPVSGAGELTLNPSVAPAGSKVVFEAVRDIVFIVSACPQDLVPINGHDSEPRLIDLYLEDPIESATPSGTG
ncbi:MAG: hypothetical protein DLM58_06170 [Pseudonocardiales bacterium]|nr:MAG: hypothetical protein DLM58_06170 [Pseudonocardiales bacterium]